MAEFEIYFAGLICHEGPSAEEGSDRTHKVRSTLVTDADHQAWIVFNGVPEPLTGDVRFEGLPPGQATVTQAFNDFVPHLDDLTRSPTKLDPTVAAKRVTLPEGELTVASLYDKHAKFTIDNVATPDRCVPRLTLLRAPASAAPVTIHYNNGQTKSLPSNGWVLIGNVSKSEPANVGDHWKTALRLTTSAHNPAALATFMETPHPCSQEFTRGTHVTAALAAVVVIHGQSGHPLPGQGAAPGKSATRLAAAGADANPGKIDRDQPYVPFPPPSSSSSPASVFKIASINHTECTNHQWP